jgi:carbamoyl-phosphate synthase large subunit
VGRRNYLVRFFQEALGGRGEVLACDSSAEAPGLSEADRRFLVPPVTDPGHLEALLSICRMHDVRLLLSVNDLELRSLAQESPRFRDLGTLPIISSPKTVGTCTDKWAAFQFMRDSNIPTPDTFLLPAQAQDAAAQGKVRFPLLIKPRGGSSSVGIDYVENDRELQLAYEWGQIQARRGSVLPVSQGNPDQCLVIQERLLGQEYGIDVVNDLCGRYVCTLGRRKLGMRAGETDRAITVNDPELEQLGRQIGETLGHVGNLDCDVMATERGWLVLDMNPRFGGGYPFSHLAGANIPAAIIAWANRDEPDPAWLRATPGISGSKGLCVVVTEVAGRARSTEPPLGTIVSW